MSPGRGGKLDTGRKTERLDLSAWEGLLQQLLLLAQLPLAPLPVLDVDFDVEASPAHAVPGLLR